MGDVSESSKQEKKTYQKLVTFVADTQIEKMQEFTLFCICLFKSVVVIIIIIVIVTLTWILLCIFSYTLLYAYNIQGVNMKI